ncbi:ferritin-like domain-containing protein [Bacillus sp. S/N-304-OC-R1]|uniref:ferritin-like domain-containing protein n=1 Tax=Bacillus sp. S/N-304-OC-R1 TaxID=2758034 RepID=UPI001C8E4333|nr:ferritin-like domain-containing protein [Bacillus sp. S/N-304-OC-R1]MBY0121823.1 ferritin-like domain-containing protein [Bacillus sp. S/N-304-OC-R1]
MYNNYYPYVPIMASYPQNQHMYPRTPDHNQQFNIPNLPLLGKETMDQLIKNTMKAIVDEATAADFYSRLLKEAPNNLHKEFVQHARNDELEHLEAFKKLYTYLTGKTPQYRIVPSQYPNYKAGLLMALKDELKAAEFYRNVQLSNTDQLVKDTFLFAMVDEIEHGTQFGVLYNSL